MGDLFPHPEIPPPPIPPPLTRPHLQPPPPNTGLPTSGDADFEQATRLIAKRLRKVHVAARREGRRIMRLLTAAMTRTAARRRGHRFGPPVVAVP